MLSLAKCRQVLGSDSPESDADVAHLRDALERLARVVLEGFSGERKAKRLPHAPNGSGRGLDDVAKSQAAPTGFSGVVAMLSEDQLYEVEERAAIHEFDGGLDRSAAERAALSEHWRTKNRKDFNE